MFYFWRLYAIINIYETVARNLRCKLLIVVIFTDNIEEITCMKKYYADKRSLNILRVILFVILIVINIALKYLLYILEMRYPEYFAQAKSTVPEIIIWGIMIAIVVIYVLYILIYLPILYNSINYFIGKNDISSVSGVFFKTKRYMKMTSIQYVTKITTPLSKYTGLNFLVISAHGGRILFTFLSKSDAEEISSYIMNCIRKENEISENITETEG